MRAAVCHEFGSPLTVEEVELAPPGPGEVSVRLTACAICHSDISFIDGWWSGTLPAVYGHEAAGIVTEIGAGVEGLRPGDHAVVTLVRFCGDCFFCARGMPVLCQTTFALDERSPLRLPDGRPLAQGARTAAFAEQVTVHASQVVPVPAEIPASSACLLACGVATGYGAVAWTVDVAEGESVVVVGIGGVGVNSVQAAALGGASPVVAVDVSAAKLEAARSFGATHTIDPAAEDVRESVLGLTGGRGADFVIVTVGAVPVIEQSLRLMRRGGTTVIVGMTADGVTAPFDPGMLAHDNARIVGSKMGSVRPPRDLPALAGLYLEGRLKLDELVSNEYPLDAVNEALEDARRGESIRNVILF
ncbi:MAG: Zn-dependent alcohol dehydrogenase [Gaiellaceae bacterium]